MEERESLLESIYEEESLDDVDMVDVEEECEENQLVELIDVGRDDDKMAVQDTRCRNRRRRAKKKKKKKSISPSSVTDINRFVIDTCRRLKEQKSYLIWNVVGCLGVAALSDLVKEVDTIQASGGQMTADGKRFRTGGGILWSILKTREPKAYKEIMTKGKEFEKQFRHPRQVPERNKENSSQRISSSSSYGIVNQVSDDFTPQTQHEVVQHESQRERKSVLNRIRVPVTYDDLFEEDLKNEST